jgi:signal transduction histidine kinase
MQVAAASNIQAIFISPILFGSEILGVYVLFSERKEGEFSSYESAVLSETGNIFGLALNRVALYQDLQNANNKLTELDARKDEFLNIAAHELRAPMTAIKGYLSMISEGDAGELSIQLKDFVDEAILGNDRLIRLVNNMLNISRIEEGRQTFEMGQSPLGIVAKTVIDEYMAQAEEKHLQLLFEKSDTVKDIVYVDKDRIYEVVSNFISNAIKYTDQGHIVVRLSNPNSTRVRVEVIDTGPGLSTEDSSKLFQKFYRAQSSAGKQMGTGLGLYVSKLLVEKFGGTIGFQSELGKGSTFWFELPLVLQ